MRRVSKLGAARLVVEKLAARRPVIVLSLIFAATATRLSARVLASPLPLAESGNPSAESSGKPEAKRISSVTLKTTSAASPDLPPSRFEVDIEQQLLDLANHDRAQAGETALSFDSGLTQAARAHAEAMLAAHELSHQFVNEPSLGDRLATASTMQFDQAGENVALDFDAAGAEQHLMHSPPHRANLLNAAYNAVGIGVVRGGDRLYIVQDFARALPNYSVAQVKERISAAMSQARHQANQPVLAAHEVADADAAACSMAQADTLSTSPVHQLAQRYSVLTYTTLHPETLPEGAGGALASRNLRSYFVGTCYARTATYPTGAYWVVVGME